MVLPQTSVLHPVCQMVGILRADGAQQLGAHEDVSLYDHTAPHWRRGTAERRTADCDLPYSGKHTFVRNNLK